MMLIRSFIFTGLICLIAQVIKDNTKLTSGHITSIFCSIGAFLGFIGVYDKIVKYFGGGASVVIMSFGNALYKGASENGILMMLSNVSVGIVTAILMGFVMTRIFRVKD